MEWKGPMGSVEASTEDIYDTSLVCRKSKEVLARENSVRSVKALI